MNQELWRKCHKEISQHRKPVKLRGYQGSRRLGQVDTSHTGVFPEGCQEDHLGKIAGWLRGSLFIFIFLVILIKFIFFFFCYKQKFLVLSLRLGQRQGKKGTLVQ